MAYIIRSSDGLLNITVPDGRIGNYGTPLQIVGTNVPDYGAAIFQNMVRITENFSSATPPEDNVILGGSPLRGQLWFNSDSGTLNYYTGNSWNEVMDADSITDPNFTVANASRFKNPLTMILYNDVSGTVTFTGNDFVALDPQYPTQLTNAVTMSVTVEKVNASKIVGTINASTAGRLTTPRTISIGGVLTGSASFDGSSNISINATGNVDTKVTLTGDVTGTGTIRNFGNVTIPTSVNFGNHNHDSLYYRKAEVDSKIAAASAGNEVDLSDYVRISTTQTITGNKTFTGAFIVSGSNATASIRSTSGNPIIDMRQGTSTVSTITGSTTYPLVVKNSSGTNAMTVSASGHITASRYISDSDVTLKSNLKPLVLSDDFMDLELMEWIWSDVERNGPRQGKVDSGIIAQQVEAIEGLEHCVTTDESGIKSVDYGKLAVHLVLALKRKMK